MRGRNSPVLIEFKYLMTPGTWSNRIELI